MSRCFLDIKKECEQDCQAYQRDWIGGCSFVRSFEAVKKAADGIKEAANAITAYYKQKTPPPRRD